MAAAKSSSATTKNSQISKLKVRSTPNSSKCKTDDEANLKIKILLYGDSGAGRTFLIRRFVEDRFVLGLCVRIGCSFDLKRVNVDDVPCVIEIWNPQVVRTEGTRYMYLRRASGVMLVYDVHNYTSFANIRTWVKEIRQKSDNSDLPILLVGTKCDLSQPRSVSFEEGRKLAEELGLDDFLEVSARTGQNVEQAFITLAALCKQQITRE